MIVTTHSILVQVISKYETKVPDKLSKDPFQKVYKDSEVTTKETKQSDTKKQRIPDYEERSEAFQKRTDEGCEMSGLVMDSAGLVTCKFLFFLHFLIKLCLLIIKKK